MRLFGLRLLSLLLVLFLAAACGDDAPQTPAGDSPATVESDATAPPTQTPQPPTSTPPPPTPTPQLAAMVNGQPILLESFEQELARYELAQAELGLTPGADGTDYRRLVLDALIERELLRQAANVAGIMVTPALVEERVEALRRAASESGTFDEWLAANQWSLEGFSEALAQEMLAEQMIATITADVPTTTEQVRASYIQVDDRELADSLAQQLAEGADFAELAVRYSRDVLTAPAGGDLGFFARGSLLIPELEEVAYRLQQGEVSDVIVASRPSGEGQSYYLLTVTDRDPSRPLTASLRQELLEARYSAWLSEQRTNATIVYLLDS